MIDLLFSREVISRLNKASKLYIGYSGGLDSTVLLHVLYMEPAFAGKLVAIHINHQLSPNSFAWQQHCEATCSAYNIEFVTKQVDFERYRNIEENARIARYAAFQSYLSKDDLLLLGHHADDQAETLLLQLLRGAGIDGLAAMPEEKPLGCGYIIRPLLHISRQILQQYAHTHQLQWIEDESNQNMAYARNFLRQTIFPLLKEKWPKVTENICRSAQHCQQAKVHLQTLAKIDCYALSVPQACLPMDGLQNLSRSRLRNVLRTWFRQNNVMFPSEKRLDNLIDTFIFSRYDAQPHISWQQVIIKRYQNTLFLLQNNEKNDIFAYIWHDFPSEFRLKTGVIIQAMPVSIGLMVPKGCTVTVRFRQGGEQIVWRGQTKQVKKLLQEWKIPTWQRHSIPLVYIDQKLAAIVPYAISDDFYGEKEAYQLRLIQ